MYTDILATKMYRGKRLDGKMKEPRTEKIVDELKDIVNRLNRIDAILQQMDVSYSLTRSKISDPWKLQDIVQRVEY